MITVPTVAANTVMSLQTTSNSDIQYGSNSNHNVATGASHIPLSIIPTHMPSSVINMTHASDVIIGPTTQYQGSVTIYQYMDATQSNRPFDNNADNRQKINNTENEGIFFLKKYWMLLTVLTISVITIAVAIYVTHFSAPETLPGGRQILFGRNYETGTIVNLGNGHLVIDREQWGAQITNFTNDSILYHPIPYVVITHIGVQSSPCYNLYKCSVKLRTIQDAAIAEKNETDLPSNFYVAGDGHIYVGRGWNITNHYANKSLSVCFMGDYQRYKPVTEQFDALDYLLTYGISNNILAKDYKLISHNQTKKTKSPGEFIYQRLKQYARWYPCGQGDYPQCGAEVAIDDWN